MAHTGRPWCLEEDQLLIQAVSVHGESDQWKTIALSVPGRTNKACRKRWLHSLSPSVKKTPWTAEEDQLLLSLYAQHSTKWSVIARRIPGRTDDACSKRYREALDPALKKDDWTAEEDARLLDLYARLGGKWGQIGHELQRSGLGSRNRWRMLERKKASALRKDPYNPSDSGAQFMAGENGDSTYGSLGVDNFWEMIPNLHSEQTPLTPLTLGAEPPPFQYASSSLTQALLPPSITERAVTPDVEMPTLTSSPEAAPPATSEISSRVHVNVQMFGSSTPTDIVGRGDSSIVATDSSALPSHTEVTFSMDVGSPGSGASSPCGERAEYPNISQNPTVTSGHSPATSDAPPDDDSGASHMYTIDGTNSLPLRSSVTITEVVPLSGLGEPRCLPPAAARRLSSNLALLDSAPAAVPQTLPETPPSTPSESPYYRPANRPRPKVSAPRPRVEREGLIPRLSSTLRVNDDSAMRPYVCGRPDCWPADANASAAAFATSGELSEHGKTEHEGESVEEDDRPFRCGLQGCGKGWKSVNGLQYHLQVSKAHFRAALVSSTSAPPPTPPSALGAHDAAELDSHDLATARKNLPAGAIAKARKTHACTHPGCAKAYKQLSGLRYHLAHGHPQEQPVQLDVVPPTLARNAAAKRSVAGVDGQ